jgi:predicted aminopeptidase
LAYAVEVRDFAFDRLALPDNGSYRDYVRLDRDFVVWNVFVTPKLSLDPIQFCYPFLGCFGYRGFFSQDRAKHYTKKLTQQGHDVFMGGVAAYSTLGWFDDPLLSSIIRREKTGIAELIFHELAHQKLYVKDDTSFNESFAMAVASAGLRLWIPLQGGDLSKFELQKSREKQFIELLLHFKDRLNEIYESNLPDHEKLSAKENTILSLKGAYESLKVTWDGDPSYDAWMQSGLNNAKIASVSTYHNYVNAFTSIFEAHGRDFSEFYNRVGVLAKFSQKERRACLQALLNAPDSAITKCPKIVASPK